MGNLTNQARMIGYLLGLVAVAFAAITKLAR